VWGSLAIGRGGNRGGSRSRRGGAQIAVWRQRQSQVHGGSRLRGGESSSSSRERRKDEASYSDGREGEGRLVLEGRLRAGDGLWELLALWDGPWRCGGSIAVERFVIHEF